MGFAESEMNLFPLLQILKYKKHPQKESAVSSSNNSKVLKMTSYLIL